MDASVIQVKYDELETVISRLRNQLAQAESMQRSLRQAYQPLQQGGWMGEGSQAFIREMEQVIFPAVARLQGALQAVEASMQETIAIMRAAEEQASNPFKGDSRSSILDGNIGGTEPPRFEGLTGSGSDGEKLSSNDFVDPFGSGAANGAVVGNGSDGEKLSSSDFVDPFDSVKP